MKFLRPFLGLAVCFAGAGLAQEPISTNEVGEATVVEILATDTRAEDCGPGKAYRYTSDFSGTLYVWAEAVGVRLRVESSAGALLAQGERDDAGRTPSCVLQVEPGEERILTVCAPEAVVAKLHLLGAPETDETRAAAQAVDDGLAEARRLYSDGAPESARELLNVLFAEIQALDASQNSARLAQVSWQLGLLARELSGPTLALAAIEWTYGHRAAHLPADHPQVLDALDYMAVTRFQLLDFDGARELEEQVLAIRIRTQPASHPGVLATKTNLAATLSSLGDLAGARVLEEEVLTARTSLLGPDHPDVLLSKENLAATWHRRGDLKGALALLENILELRKQSLGPEHPELLRSKQNVAVLKSDLGELEEALELEEEVVAARTRLQDAAHPDLLTAKGNLAATKFRLGDLAGARVLQEEVLEAWLRQLPADHPNLLNTKRNLAGTRLALGDLVGALELQEEVFAAYSRTYDSEHPDLLGAKGGLAVLKRRLGDLQGALQLDQEVLAVRRRIHPPDHPEVLGALQNQALTKRALGDLAGALEIEEQVLAMRAQVLQAGHPDLLDAKQNIALTRGALGDLVGAAKLQEDVLAALAQRLTAGHPSLINAKQALAATRVQLGEIPQARELIQDYLAGMRERALELRMESPRGARESAAAELVRLFSTLSLAEAADSTQALAVDLFETLESLRSVSIGSSEVALALREHADLDAKHEEIALLRAQLNDHSAFVPSDGAKFQEWSREASRLALERDRLEWSLRSALGEAGLFVESVDAGSIVAGLAPDAFAISYLRYVRTVPAAGVLPDAPEDALLAFVVVPDGKVRLVELGASREIEELFVAWRTAISKPVAGAPRPADPQQGALRTPDELATEIRDRILKPLLDLAPRARVLHIVPDDFLYLVPFDALPFEGGLLGEHYTVHTEVALARPADPANGREENSHLLLAGGIDYDVELPLEDEDLSVDQDTASVTTVASPLETPGDSAEQLAEDTPRIGRTAESFAFLPGSGSEVEAIGALFTTATGGDPLRLEGAAATKAALYRHAPQARFLHVATHGWFAAEGVRSRADWEGLKALQQEQFLQAEQWIHGFAPETLCGLALAGANLGRDGAGRVTGILTAEELAAFDLRNCELAVLSGCATNVGVRRAGQGIQSLQNALHAAGVRTAITSLWQVDDRWTARLMEELYTRIWRDGGSKSEALWAAKMALREQNVPQSEWAAWVLTGAPD